jgi:hypothetical protein
LRGALVYRPSRTVKEDIDPHGRRLARIGRFSPRQGCGGAVAKREHGIGRDIGIETFAPFPAFGTVQKNLAPDLTIGTCEIIQVVNNAGRKIAPRKREYLLHLPTSSQMPTIDRTFMFSASLARNQSF